MSLSGDQARELSKDLIDKYFRTVTYPYNRHHIDSYDQFLQQDLVNIIRSQNPVLILKDLIDADQNLYKYRVEIYIGGQDGTAIEIGTPTISLQNSDEVRLLYPNEARLRNLTYAANVYADILVKITYVNAMGQVIDLSPPEDAFVKFNMFKMPIMLHSRYCVLHDKPKHFLREAGECVYDNGGYFIVDGAEKVLITLQEQAFNTLYITPQNDPKVSVYASIECISPKTRQVKRVSFSLMRHVEKEGFTSHETIQVTLPFVRKPVPLFVLFRALGFQSDEEIIRLIFPDFESPEAKLLLPKLRPSIIEGFPFMNTYLAVQYIATLTKGFSIAHVLDIIKNQLFIHMENDSTTQAIFLGDCVRRILRVSEGYDNKTDRDDTRNQRCLTSGFLIQELFINSYKLWIKAFVLAIGKEYNYNKEVLYRDENFKNIFQPANESKIFMAGLLNDMLMKGFKGKWGTGLGEEKSGVLQALSRLSYTDFMSHCRRVILNFDTSMKLTGPRKLHTSQYGYFCTSETPTGSSIGITKNMSIMTCISTSSQTDEVTRWLRTTGRVYKAEDMTMEQRVIFVPVYMNGGMFGYTAKPHLLTRILKLFKRSGCLPYSVSISFSIRDRKVYLYMDAGRPLRPLIWLHEASRNGGGERIPIQKLSGFRTWRQLVMGNLPARDVASLDSTDFMDPLAGREATLEQYEDALAPYTGAIEYIDPYEQNETFIANNPAYITPETTHIEVHPSTIMSMMTSLIPFAPHNQSPRNQLSCSQSKQGLSIYATNWRNRFDNTAHVLCYGELPITRTIYNNYLGEGRMAYGMNCILAIACWSGYNQEDGIVMNYDAVQRGMFRSMAFRSYEAFEEDDEKAGTRVRFGNPMNVGTWTDLKPGLDYSKLDENGIIREGEYVDENTVIVGAYMLNTQIGRISDASKTPQVWTTGRVEKVAVMVNNMGLRLVKIRVVQDRVPELGDKFSNRHGQKGTIGALLRGHDMPRTVSGIVPDMIMNPHAIPSRMTIAQNLEQLLGKTAALSGAIGDGTSFMNDGSPQDEIGGILDQMGFERYGNEIMYNGATGEQIQAAIFIGPVYGMRLKHMVEDKWQARGKGRKEVRTHQPTGGRGAQGGLKIGEMDRDAIIAHGGMAFVKESFMERSDGDTMNICVSCGTMPIYNPRMKIAICPLCDGPVRFSGDTIQNFEILPSMGRPKSKIVQVELPYSTKLLTQEQESFLNLSMRYITTKDIQRLRPLELTGTVKEEYKVLEPMIYQDVMVAKIREEVESTPITVAQLKSMGVTMEQEMKGLDVIEEEPEMLNIDESGVPIEAVLASNQVASNANPVIMPQAIGQAIPQAMSQDMPLNISQAMPQVMPQAMPQSMGQQNVPPMNATQSPPPMIGGLSLDPLMVQHIPGPIPLSTGPGRDGIVGGTNFLGLTGGTIAVDTSSYAMERQLSGGFGGGFGPMMHRTPRRGGFRSMGGGMGFGGMVPNVPSYTPSPVGGSGGDTTGTITVRKMDE
jgi:DNA-directed RNA polymerase II subunit RPB2